ncbi:MAG: hypothetical protein V4722_04060 [Bacteroidota bacterium]
MKKIFLAISTFISFNGYTQSDSIPLTKIAIDTTALLDSMELDLALLRTLMTENTSYFDINVNLGNQVFSRNNFSLNSQQTTENTLSLKPGAGYYHKSGLSLSGMAYLNLSHTAGGFYQYSITPGFAYAGKGKVAAGISYTHYFTMAKDTLPDFATPYDNEFYGYIYLAKGAIQPGIVLGYATGTFTSIFRGKVQGPLGGLVFVVDSQKTKRSDFSVSGSLQHDFEWYDVLSKKDGLSFTPVLMLNAGSSTTKVLAHSNKLVNNIIARRPNNRFRIQNAGFEIYSVGLSLNVMYEVGKFYLQPQGYFDYYLQDSDKKLTGLFSITAGINL